MPAPFARACESGRSLRSRGRRAVGGASRAKDSPPAARTAKVALPAEGTLEGSRRRPSLPPILHREENFWPVPRPPWVGAILRKMAPTPPS
jgi:hypothetical protein